MKNQCDKCKWFIHDHCSYLNCNIEQDGISCPYYSNISINLSKSDNIGNKDIDIDIEQNTRQEKMRGWLVFFLFSMGLSVLANIIFGFTTFSLSDYDVGFGDRITITGAVSDIILISGMVILGIYTIVSFCNYRPNAVALAKSYLILAFTINLMTLLSGGYEETGFDSFPQLAGRLSNGIIWFIYLYRSRQISSLFPKENRKWYQRDKVLLFSTITPNIVWIILVFSLAFHQGYQEENNAVEFSINGNTLSMNEYTDGRIIFACPIGIIAEKQIVNNETCFSLTGGDHINMVLYSTFDDNDTKEYFEECMQNWKDRYFDYFQYEIINETHYVSNGNSVYQKTLQYYSEPVIDWSFVIIFNKKTSKCCLISCFSTKETDCLDEVITSIRFK